MTRRAAKGAAQEAPEGFVSWSEENLRRLVRPKPEAVVAIAERMRVGHSECCRTLAREDDPRGDALAVRDNHEGRSEAVEARPPVRSPSTDPAPPGVDRAARPYTWTSRSHRPRSTYALADPSRPWTRSGRRTPSTSSSVRRRATLEDPRQVCRLSSSRRGEKTDSFYATGPRR